MPSASRISLILADQLLVGAVRQVDVLAVEDGHVQVAVDELALRLVDLGHRLVDAVLFQVGGRLAHHGLRLVQGSVPLGRAGAVQVAGGRQQQGRA
ncbi:hypothetical protein [Rugamonas sp. DEMB1]|uniref:hypothetical protein n=1 Tax=Rugamonas sp. DEMB1 TaxID=3039386 RepID=UPI00244AFCAF|nr:hypothetical protein [Rugamonas sp. DEMB1]WGG50997.1 hypothetical protein QC826_01450 [Rugamonas sp. DEMB1]